MKIKQTAFDFGDAGAEFAHRLPAPHARRTDPETSHKAAAQAVGITSRHAGLIMTALREHGPAGKDGIAARTHELDGVQVARTLSILAKAGFIVCTGNTVLSDAGREEREWKAA